MEDLEFKGILDYIRLSKVNKARLGCVCLESHAYKSMGRAEFKASFSHKPGLLQNLFLNTFKNNNKEFF